MAVAVDAATLGGNTLSFSHTVGVGDANRYLVVGIAIGGTSISVSSMTYGGVAMTLLKRQVGTSAAAAELWGLVAPLTGANTVAITLSGANPGVGVGATSFTGVDQINPTDGNALGATGTSVGATSAAKTGVIGDMLTDVIADANAVTTPTGTQQWNDSAGDAASTLAADGSSQTISWTTGISAVWADVIALLKQVSALPAIEVASRHTGFGPF